MYLRMREMFLPLTPIKYDISEFAISNMGTGSCVFLRGKDRGRGAAGGGAVVSMVSAQDVELVSGSIFWRTEAYVLNFWFLECNDVAGRGVVLSVVFFFFACEVSCMGK